MNKRKYLALLAFLPATLATSTSSAAPIVIEEIVGRISIDGNWSINSAAGAAIVSAINSALASWKGAANQSYGPPANSSSFCSVSSGMRSTAGRMTAL